MLITPRLLYRISQFLQHEQQQQPQSEWDSIDVICNERLVEIVPGEY